jgi:2-methylcitrate dehydratase
MRQLNVRVYDLADTPPKEEQLAWALAETASDKAPIDDAAADMAANRVIDNSAVAMAAINVDSVAAARAEALAHTRPDGAALYGMSPLVAVHCEWAAWANATAVRELDFHDSFFGADVAHTGDTMSGVIAVAQQMGCYGEALLKGILTAYEVHIALAHNIPLAASLLDHPGHIVPAVACGAGAMLGLDTETIFQAVQHSVHVSATTGQARRGEITSWKANAPGHSSMLAIHAIDRAMRGERSPGPIYEGDYGFLAAYVKPNPDGYRVNLPEPGEPKRMILETYTKEHAAGYHGQVPIDLAVKMRGALKNLDQIESIVLHTKLKTHMMMGAGAGDKSKWDPTASRETLDHSAMYCFAVALEDGIWHHENSYKPERAQRPDTVALWQKITTVEDKEWTRRYDEPAPLDKDHGMHAVVTYKDGTVVEDEMDVPNAHPRGARPFGTKEYEQKFRTLTDGIVETDEADRFIGLATGLRDLSSAEVRALLPVTPIEKLVNSVRDDKGIF